QDSLGGLVYRRQLQPIIKEDIQRHCRFFRYVARVEDCLMPAPVGIVDGYDAAPSLAIQVATHAIHYERRANPDRYQIFTLTWPQLVDTVIVEKKAVRKPVRRLDVIINFCRARGGSGGGRKR